MFSRINGYFEEINGNMHFALVPTNERKEETKEYEELWLKSEI